MTADEKRAAFQRLAHSPGLQTAQAYADAVSSTEVPMQSGDRVTWTIDRRARYNCRAQ